MYIREKDSCGRQINHPCFADPADHSAIWAQAGFYRVYRQAHSLTLAVWPPYGLLCLPRRPFCFHPR